MEIALRLSFSDGVGHALTLAAGALGAAITLKLVVERAFGWTYEGLRDRRRLRFTMHRAAFAKSGREAYFMTATNLSRARDVELTHVWMAGESEVHFRRPERPLPHRLKPDESWETWVFRDELPTPPGERVFYLGRLRLSTGAVLKSRPNRSMPAIGSVPGGPIALAETGIADRPPNKALQLTKPRTAPSASNAPIPRLRS